MSVAGARAAGVEDREVLDLFGGDDQYVSTSRIPRPTSRIAENVTVITADQIAALNAHTLAEVLQTVPGFQLEQVRTPGSWSDVSLQGASSAHLQLLIDGVPQLDLLQNQVDPGSIGVQHIERVEIIKGAASTAWGQALGGVINVITKSPNTERQASGTLFSSIGERFTSDLHGDFTGTVQRFGYYLSAGNLHSDGLLHNTAVDKNSVYAKFNYQLPGQGLLTFGTDFYEVSRGSNETVNTHDAARSDRGYSFLNLFMPFGNQLRLDIDLRESRKNDQTWWGDYFGGVVFPYRHFKLNESTRGGGVKLTLGDQVANLVLGGEYEHDETHQWEVLVDDPSFYTNKSWDRWGVYSNGSLTLGPLTILPGIRFDQTGLSGDALSYSAGATLGLTEKTVLRGYFARGYSLPNAIWNNGPQRVITYQGGLETGEIPNLWLKGTYFYNNIWNVEVGNFDPTNPTVNLRSQVKQGFEVEAHTVPVYNFALSSGYTYIDARDRDTGLRLYDVPEHGVKLGLTYQNHPLGLTGILTGNYVRWFADPGNGARDHSTIFDLSLTQKLSPETEQSPELFFSVHNLFNDSQYLKDRWQNTGRWLEGGARFKF
ncbi:TonB-dependent receptor plug domain-containing protein [Geomonas limicola]|nr:TonB-dependent receptor plug domain-containing protein [Geomonas limicola]